MRLHRFYVGGLHDKWGALELKQEMWVHDTRLINQWLRVLRYRTGDELVLFDDETERQYKIITIEQPQSVQLQLVTERQRVVPKRHVYLLWSLLKKDKNDWVLQKATELGVRNFVPIVAERSEKTGFVFERAQKIIIEAAEQCGRSDIPHLREPISLPEAVAEYKDKIQLHVCEQTEVPNPPIPTSNPDAVGVLIGPEGGWTEAEKSLFVEAKLLHISIAQFTLRAETAVVTALGKFL